MNPNRIARLFAASAAAALAVAPVAAQGTLTARSLGTAGSWVADARGVDALFFNPANLGLHNNPYWTTAMPQFALRTGFVGTRLGQVPSLFHFNKWSQGEKDAFVGGIPQQGMNANLSITVPVAAIQYKRVAVGVSYTARYNENVGRDVVDLLVNGYQEGRTDYAVGNTSGRSASWLDFSAGTGRSFGKVSVGVAGHYIMGHAMAQHRLFEPEFNVEAQDLNAELREVAVRGGTGWGVDLGIAAEPAKRLTVSAAVANAFSGMRWSGDFRTKSLVLSKADFHKNAALEALDRFDASETAVDPSSVPVTVYETARGLYDNAWLPATVRAGVAYSLPSEKTRLTASYQGALDEGSLDGGWRRRISGGVEHTRGIISLRAGAGTDASGSYMLATGFSAGPIQLGLARTSEPRESARSSGWTFAFGLTARNLAVMP
ncbi:MAG TPA: DUF5723 family protein [Longimicrobium sp.]|nr:DUF5723 family protein [Longimicrobium sp.]